MADINNGKKVWDAIDDSIDALLVQTICKGLDGIKRIGFVVPMRELRTTMKTIFNSVEGLSSSMVLGPEEVVNNWFDILVVDEAHRLYKRKNLPGGIVKRFDSINKQLMGDNYTESEDDLNIRFLFDLEVLNDLHVDLMREVAVHGEEKLAFCIIPDVITDFVCGDIAIDYIFCDVYSEVLPIIIGIPNVC